jgi:hypothetical protein
VELLGELFGLFKTLRVIYLHEDNILKSESQRMIDALVNGPENQVEEANTIEAYVHTIASSCEALQDVSVRRSYPFRDWYTISRTRNPSGTLVCSLKRRTIEDRDLERQWTS